MASLRFVDTHNMVAFLSKPAEVEGFEQIVDFINAHPIRYALTVNPTIYVSCIEQFWSTTKAKTVNGEVLLHVKVDGKEIVITESSVRRDLQLADEGDQAAFTSVDDRTGGAATSVSSLDAGQGSGNIHKTPSISHDSLTRGNTLGSDEDRLKLQEVIETCTNLQQRVLGLENAMKKTKTTHALEIASLNRKIKRLEKQNRSRTHKLKRFYKVRLTSRIESSDEEINVDDVNENADNVADDVVMEAQEVEDVVEEVVDVISTAKVLVDTSKVSTAEVSTAIDNLSTAYIHVSAATTTPTTTITATTTTTTSTTTAPKQKGVKHQLLQDEEDARRLQAESDEEERIAREKEEADASLCTKFDDVQARIEDEK
ncbi:hypothetical protein Tco_0764778 [Tanacetum coccineum]